MYLSANSVVPRFGKKKHVLVLPQFSRELQWILKGEKKASDMNFETITEPGFYVNEKVAENLGVTVPQDLADEAVESFTEITK